MENTKRTVTCGELRAADVGKKVVLNGWVSRTRDLGGLVFIRLRLQSPRKGHSRASRMYSGSRIPSF